MKLSKTALRLLLNQYSAILMACLVGIFVSTEASATVTLSGTYDNSKPSGTVVTVTTPTISATTKSKGTGTASDAYSTMLLTNEWADRDMGYDPTTKTFEQVMTDYVENDNTKSLLQVPTGETTVRYADDVVDALQMIDSALTTGSADLNISSLTISDSAATVSYDGTITSEGDLKLVNDNGTVGDETDDTYGTITAGDINSKGDLKLFNDKGTAETTDDTYGSITAGNITANGTLTSTGVISGASISTTGDITSNGDLTLSKTEGEGAAATTTYGTVTAGNVNANGNITSTGNLNLLDNKGTPETTDDTYGSITAGDIAVNGVVTSTTGGVKTATLGGEGYTANVTGTTVNVGDTSTTNLNLKGENVSVTGTTVLDTTKGLQFGATGQNVTSIDNGLATLTPSVANATTLATTASVLKSAENAAYSGTQVGGKTDPATIKSALADTNVQVNKNTAALAGSFNAEGKWTPNYTANGLLDPMTDSVHTVKGDLDTISQKIGNTDYVGNNISASATISKALDDLDGAIGTKIATDGNYIKKSATNTVNDNISALDTAIGSKETMVAGANVSDSTNNLASAVNQLDTAIGNRVNLNSKNTAINTAIETSVSAGLKATGNTIGSMDFVNTRYINSASDLTSVSRVLDSNLNRVEGRVDELEKEVDKMDDRMNSGFASLAALSGLQPNARACSDTQISMGAGTYRGKVGGALGAFHYFNDNLMMNIGASYAGNSSATVRGGLTFGW